MDPVAALDRVATLLEKKQAGRYKEQAFRKAADAIRDVPVDELRALAERGGEVVHVVGPVGRRASGHRGRPAESGTIGRDQAHAERARVFGPGRDVEPAERAAVAVQDRRAVGIAVLAVSQRATAAQRKCLRIRHGRQHAGRNHRR